MKTQVGHEECVINGIKSKFNSLKDDMRAFRNEVGRDEPKFSSVESNSMIRRRDDNIPTEGPIPIERMLLLSGTMNGLSVKVLKEDGYITNLVSKEFLSKYNSRNIFEVYL